MPPPDAAKPGLAPGRSVRSSGAPSATATPFSAGSFLIYPELDATFMYDDNLYFTPKPTVSDHAWIYSSAIWVQSNWTEHALNFYAATDSTRYQNYKTEDSDDYRFSSEGRYDFNADTNLYGGAYFGRSHEDRESPSASNGLTPTTYYQRRFYGGFFRQSDRFTFRIAGTAQHLDYRDVSFITGSGAINIINNDDRDRWQYTGGIRIGYEVSPRFEPYVQIAFDNRRYYTVPDDHGDNRNSTGQRYLAGLRWNLSGMLKLDAFAGWLSQDYSDARFSTVNAPAFGGVLQWEATQRTTVSVLLDRTIEETNVTYTPSPGTVLVASSYLNTFASTGIQHRFTNQFSIRASASASRVEYEGIPRADDYYGLSLGTNYRLHKNLFLDFSINERKLNSNAPTQDFAKHTVFARITLPFSH